MFNFMCDDDYNDVLTFYDYGKLWYYETCERTPNMVRALCLISRRTS